MSEKDIEKMKKLIDEKKKISAQQGYREEDSNKMNPKSSKGFKNTKRGGSLNK